MIPFVRQMDFQYGVAERVSPLIRRVVANNPGPYTFLGTGTYIVGQGEVAVIDPGPSLPDHLDAILASLNPHERVTHIILTHHHADHSPLGASLRERTGASTYGRSVADDPSGGTIEFGCPIDIELKGSGEELRGPNWTLQAIHTPGHTSNHLCFALPQENALFSGDHVMGWATTVVSPPDGDMGAYMSSLSKIRERAFSTLWPTHGPPIREVNPFIDAYIEHRREREAQVLAALGSEGLSVEELVSSIYIGLDTGLRRAAGRTVSGHLTDLVRRGEVLVDEAREGERLYRIRSLEPSAHPHHQAGQGSWAQPCVTAAMDENSILSFGASIGGLILPRKSGRG